MAGNLRCGTPSGYRRTRNGPPSEAGGPSSTDGDLVGSVGEALLQLVQLVAELAGQALADELEVLLDEGHLASPRLGVDPQQFGHGVGVQVEPREVERLGGGDSADGGVDGGGGV